MEVNMEEFKNYKEKQNYFKEKYKNREKLFFGQPPIMKNNKGEIIKPKGKVYINYDKRKRKALERTIENA